MAAQSVWDLGRNDVDSCVAYHKAKGRASADERIVMLRLQDDPHALMSIMRGWEPLPDPDSVEPVQDAQAADGESPGSLTDDERDSLDGLVGRYGAPPDDAVDDDAVPEPELPEEEPNTGDDEREDGDRLDGIAVGYNPYRAGNGQFGSGPHKARPQGQRRTGVEAAAAKVEATHARVGKAADKLTKAQVAHKLAVDDARAKLNAAQEAHRVAEAKGTKKSQDAARVATNKATMAAAKADRHAVAVSKHEVAHAKATTSHAEAKSAHAEAKAKANTKAQGGKETPDHKGKPAPPAGDKTGAAAPAKASATPPTGDHPKERAPAEPSQPTGLAHVKIDSIEPLSGSAAGLNSSYIAKLGDGGKAVFKPASGESAYDGLNPMRSNIQAGTYHTREVAAYKLAEHMGMKDMVPETATVTHNGEVGSLQRWHQGGKLLAMEGDPNGHLEGGGRFDHESSERVRVFDYVTGNSDRHAGNILVDSSSGSPRPILIDHGLTFPRGAPDRFIQPTNAMSEERELHPNTLKMIEGMNPRAIAQTLKESGIEPEAVRHTLIRVKALQSDPRLIATPWSNPAHDAWNMYATEAHRMVGKPAMKEIDDIIAGS